MSRRNMKHMKRKVTSAETQADTSRRLVVYWKDEVCNARDDIYDIEKLLKETTELVAKMNLYIKQDRAYMIDMLLVSKPVKHLLENAEKRIISAGGPS